MTCRAARQHLFAANLVVLHQILALFLRKIIVPPLHVRYLGLWPDMLFRRAVASDTPLHLKCVFLVNRRHIVDLSVAARTTNTLVYMNTVIEINKLGQVVNSFPLDGFILTKAGPNGL